LADGSRPGISASSKELAGAANHHFNPDSQIIFCSSCVMAMTMKMLLFLKVLVNSLSHTHTLAHSLAPLDSNRSLLHLHVSLGACHQPTPRFHLVTSLSLTLSPSGSGEFACANNTYIQHHPLTAAGEICSLLSFALNYALILSAFGFQMISHD